MPKNLANSLVESVIINDIDSFVNNEMASFETDPNYLVKKRQVIDMSKALKNPKYKKLLLKDEHSHGFLRPFSLHQKISWVVFAFNLVLEGFGITNVLG